MGAGSKYHEALEKEKKEAAKSEKENEETFLIGPHPSPCRAMQGLFP